MKKKLLSPLLALLLLVGSLQASRADNWKVSLLPASLNSDKTIRMVAGNLQVVTMNLQAVPTVTKQADKHLIGLELDFPAGMELIHNKGLNGPKFYEFTAKSTTTQNGRTVVQYEEEIENNYLVGVPSQRITTEWKNHAFFFKAPDTVAPGQNYLSITLRHAGNAQTFTWPLEVSPLAATTAVPKRTKLGLWDYGYYRADSPAASSAMMEFYKKFGIGFVQVSYSDTYSNALKNAGIVAGNEVHHSAFALASAPDYDSKGNAHHNHFPDPQAIIDLPAGAEIPGVKQLIEKARKHGGTASYDFEPTGRYGFSPLSVSTFKKKYNVSDEEFEKFRAYVAANDLQTHKATDPLIAGIWKNWTEFRSQQSRDYVRRIYEAVKAAAPEVRIAITSSRSYGHGTKGTLAIGTDNSAIAAYTDVAMPQIYVGYGGAAAKLAMRSTQGWHEEIKKQNPATQLWPLLLVRYAGATPTNSPRYVYQQAIGSVAHGAQGIVFYYSGNMDGPYWNVVSRVNQDLAKYEDFYLDGKRIDEQFKLSSLPQGNTQVNMYPGYPEPVENPGWAFTAHELGNKVLLTLINLEEANDLVFGIDVGSSKYLSGENVEAVGGKLSTILEEQTVALTGVNQWLVAPGQVGYIVLERTPAG